MTRAPPPRSGRRCTEATEATDRALGVTAETEHFVVTLHGVTDPFEATNDFIVPEPGTPARSLL